jgi:hypothetical protein
MPARRTLDLTEAQRAELARARDRDPRPYLRDRCAALLKVAAGQSVRAVARAGLGKRRRPETVGAWVERYEAGGRAGLAQRPRRRRGLPP